MISNVKIFYLAPDNNTPSWGLGIIYYHVLALREAGFNAFIIHQKSPFKVSWLQAAPPVLYWNESPQITPADILVVPEVMVNLKGLKKLTCRKLLFVQASSFLFEMMPENENHSSLGFESAIGIMPHMMAVIEKFTRLKADMVPPFVAPYFKINTNQIHKREKKILIFPKFYQQDFGIVKYILNQFLTDYNPGGLKGLFKEKWKLIVLKDKSHKEVAQLMKEAAFFIATNTFESFNASCVEAMSAGCIPVCYEAFGPRDYMINGKHAFVFPNNEAFKLADKVIDLVQNYDSIQEELHVMRTEGYHLSETFNYENTKNVLVSLMKSKLPLS